MADSPAIDHEIPAAAVELLTLVSACPGPEREAVLLDLVRRIGPRQLARLFAQFIGLANSVVADDQRRQTIPEALSALADAEPQT